MNETNKKILILIIEDEKVLADTLGEKLEAEGFNVIKTVDGNEGLKLALSEHPELILLDLLMPNVDGLTILKKLREDPWGLHVKVIILTNVNDPNKVAEGMAAGLDGTYEYLVKVNWSLDSVVSRIKQKLGIKD